MAREIDRSDATAGGEEQVKDGSLIVEERMTRRDGLVEYEGTVEGESAPSTRGAVRETVTTAETQPVVEQTTVRETVSTSIEPSDALSMSTDNTAKGVIGGGTTATGPITLVREGMTVVDASGEELGTVDQVQMGDPTAVTTQGQDAGDDGGVFAAPVGATGGSGSGLGAGGGGLAAPLAASGVGGDLDLPEAFGADLRRVGFVKIDGKGLFDRDRYAAADEIADVSGQTVRLGVVKDALRTS
jgi:hypothetical protein